MAADEALLDHTARGRPALRFYTWSAPTLSLGYFQRSADRLTDARIAGLPYVRRPTGGGAIVHHHELTYALALPIELSRGEPDWICRMHDVVRTALVDFGVPSVMLGCGRETGRDRFLCFEHLTPGDVVIGDAKVVGSARRKRLGAVLQHGSILLAASPFTPRLTGIRELVGVTIEAGLLAQAMAEAFQRTTSWELREGEWQGQLRTDREAAERSTAHPPGMTDGNVLCPIRGRDAVCSHVSLVFTLSP